MSGVPLETCWAFNKLWNNKFYYKAASCWYFYWVIYDARIHEYQTYFFMIQRNDILREMASFSKLWTFLCFDWKCQCMCKSMVMLPTYFATDHSDGATQATERTRWWWHLRRTETCKFSNVWCLYILVHVKLVMKINPSFKSSNQILVGISAPPPPTPNTCHVPRSPHAS
jgi:hypothetical protein